MLYGFQVLWGLEGPVAPPSKGGNIPHNDERKRKIHNPYGKFKS